ncbi:ABC transporter permease [Actinopolymorpha pittospori]|uniref:ABC transport system permease protein n=1 Tax=Actinopolymorpha pittospori TaxID=648752 RepID=A0A927RNJ6_9ACTN|nr:ABC transporter permease [Actinopolymorpha pittospori]MBE1610143.1 putative ABC transport system permease protein [Actinopolymorpha pittospori]
MRTVLRVGWAAVGRRRLQSLVIAAVVLLSSCTAMVALGLLVASNAPFDHAFARQHGAHTTASFDPAKASAADLTATADRPGVTATAGPFDAVTARLLATTPHGTRPGPDGLIVGRAETATPVDRLELTDGTWLTGPGQIVLSRDSYGTGDLAWRVGTEITVDVPGKPTLRVVGIADSITGTADAWVWPTQTNVLRAEDAVASRQMLYRFDSSRSDTAIRTSLSAATAALPDGALTGSSAYLAVKLRAEGNLKPMVPFVVTFAVVGLVISALIVVNVVSGAVVAGFRTIGVQKTLGFTPGQVVGVYVGQILAVGVPACLLGVLLGRLLATPLLAQTAEAYALSSPATIPAWVDLLVLLGVPVMVGLAAIVPAARAGRLSAVQAITVGRAPSSGRGFRIRRALAATGLPRPVSFGLGTPFARPARAAVTVVAVLLGATTVVFATGLATSLSEVAAAFNRTAAVPVTVELIAAHVGPGPAGGNVPAPRNGGGNGGGPPQPADPAAVRAIIQAQPGTARLVATSEQEVDLAGSTEPLSVRAYDGDPSWVGYPLISGRWYDGPDEAVAGSRMLRLTGTKVGDHITIRTSLGERRVHVVGEAFSNVGEATLIMGTEGLDGLVEHLTPNRFEIGLTQGTEPHAYADALLADLRDVAAVPQVTADTQENETIQVMLALIATLSLLLVGVAALGVFNTVVLNTRERVHEIGVLRSVGMTPGQVRWMVVTSMVTIGLVGGALAVPLGYALHRWILHAIGEAAGTDVPHSVVAVYGPLELVGLGACGIVLAVLGALIPAGWAAGTRVATALHAE